MAKGHRILLTAALLLAVLAVPGLLAGGTKEEEVTGPAVTVFEGTLEL